jgi:hypothetical protein
MRISRMPLLAALAAALACSGTEGTPTTVFDAPAPVVVGGLPRADVERDLTLTLRQPKAAPLEREQDPHLEVVLANRSTDRTYPVVLSSDGSEAGWREPHVWYTVERRVAGGRWEAAPQEPLLRCGNYDEDWAKDLVQLAPGKELTLPWFRFYDQWDLDGASALRVVAHYAYGDHAKDVRKVPPALHTMPAYALASNALELPLDEPLVLELRVKGPLPSAGQPFGSSVEVIAVNRSDHALPFATTDTGATLSLDVEVQDEDGRVEKLTIATSLFDGAPARDTIAAGGRRSVLGPQTKTSEDSFMPGKVRVRRVRARVWVRSAVDDGDGERSRVAHSPWVDVK